MNRFILVLALGLFTSLTTFAQDWKRTQNWYFGDSAGLSFATDPPTVLTDGQMYALEGCATISDTAGNLLFYTNGMTVWNKNHEIMDNGTGLFGWESSAQAALIVPQPGNDSVYFIFTNGGEMVISPFALRYSIVKMGRNGGLGMVTEKNIFLLDNPSEKLAATMHSNRNDVWVSVHGFDNNNFYSFLVTSNGVINCPVVSSVGSVMAGGAAQTQMQFSYSGSLACVSFYSSGFCELLQFDNRLGKFSNPIKIITKGAYPVGICFSSNEKRLYIAEKGTSFVQYNIDSLANKAINDSRRIFYTHFSIGNDFKLVGEKIYFGLPGNSYMGYFIPSQYSDSLPNMFDSSLNISPGLTTFGSPNFISSYYYQPKLDIHYKTNCDNDSVAFSARSVQGLVSPVWDVFRNGNLIYSDSKQSLNYFFGDTGIYFVRLIDNTDTVEKSIFIEPKLELGIDTVICSPVEFVLSIPKNIRCLKWQDGSDTASYSVTKNGVYYISGYNNKGCKVSDTILVKFGGVQQPSISRSGDSLFTDTGSYEYTWYLNGTKISANTNALRINETGNYSVEVSDSIGCKSVSNIFPITALSVSKKEVESIHVFPNPLTEGQNLTLEGILNSNQIQIYTTLGTQIHSFGITAESDAVIISGLQRGVYILVINDIARYKILVQ